MPHDPGHYPVMCTEVVQLLGQCKRGVIVDCTVGLGGHSQALLDSWQGEGLLIGMDVDEDNLRQAKQNLERFGDRVRLFHANFSELKTVLSQAGVDGVDALVADLGVASTHLDLPDRGFSFSKDGPLDMRMDMRIKRTAGDIVNTIGQEQLADLIFEFGQERFSRKIAKAIVFARKSHLLNSTAELSQIICAAMPGYARQSRKGVHPATRTFQALRIAVNSELDVLEKLLSDLPSVLNVEGRAAIISFHSLEDKRVKQSFSDWAGAGTAERITKKPLSAQVSEIDRNPRSRSAKLRCIQRIA